MNPKELFETMTRITKNGNMTIRPGPVKLAVGPQDAIAARMLLWLFDQMPPDAATQDLHDVLDSAKWWAIFTETSQLADEREMQKLDEKI